MESEDSSSNDSFKSDGQNDDNKTRESSGSIEDLANIGENEMESLNMSHQDLSDVSDLESGQSSDEKSKLDKFDGHEVKDLREKLDERKNLLQGLESSNGYEAKEKKTDEDVLDFEAEEGECNDEKDDVSHNKVCFRIKFIGFRLLVHHKVYFNKYRTIQIKKLFYPSLKKVKN